MARRFLLPCKDCEKVLTVETTQAGQQITCPGCKASVTIGTLRDIQALEPVEKPGIAPPVGTSTGMSVTNRLIFVTGALLLAVGGIWGGLSTLRASNLNVETPTVVMPDQFRQGVEDMSPTQMLANWEQLDVSQVEEWKEPEFQKLQKQSRESRIYSFFGFGVAGLGLLGLVGSLVLKF